MENIKQISDLLKSNADFKEQEDGPGRRYYFMKNGERFAYIWFKWALNGWNIIIGKQKERYHIDSVDKLKELLSL